MNARWHAQHAMPRAATREQRRAWHAEHQRSCGCRPIPQALSGLPRPRAPAGPARGGDSLRALLSGGDRRSLARSSQALALVHANPGRVAELAALAKDEDWLVSLRALDLLEKLAGEHPEWVEPHRRVFIGALADSDKWEVHLQVVRALPRFRWSRGERRRVLAILRRDVSHPQKFVRAWALDSLARFAETDAALAPIVARHLEELERSGSSALVTRARHIRERLAARPPAVRDALRPRPTG
jgi:HEAT repeat protein